MAGKPAAAILTSPHTAAALANQKPEHHQRTNHHWHGKAKDLDARLEGKVAELIGGEGGENLNQEDEEGSVGRDPRLHGDPPVGKEGGVLRVGFARKNFVSHFRAIFPENCSQKFEQIVKICFLQKRKLSRKLKF